MKWIDKFSIFIGESTSYFYLIAASVTVFEVVMRYAFNAPTAWAHELTIMLCALGYLWSSGYVTQKNTHIRITAVYDLLPPKTRLLLDLFSVIFGFVVIALLLYAAWGKGIRALSVWERTGSSWDPPLYAIVKPAIILGAGFFCLQLFSNFVKLVRRYRELADNAPRPNSSPNQK